MNTYKVALTSAENNVTITVDAETEFMACRIAKMMFKNFSNADCHVTEVKLLKSRTDKILIFGSFALFAVVFVMTVWQLGG